MSTSSPENAILNWFGQVNYSTMEWINSYWWPILAAMLFISFLIGMSPLRTHHDQTFIQIICVWIRKIILWTAFIMATLPFITLYLYDMTMQNQLADSQQVWVNWFINLAKQNFLTVISAAISGWILRFIYKRYGLPIWSAILRRFRNSQTDESPTDIRQEANRFKEKNFLPEKYYKNGFIFTGLNKNSNPIYIPESTWYETNMQVIGPTRYGKGVEIGNLMDQIIRNNDCLFYIDPKKDKFAPHIMYQACQASGRKFYYVTLHDDGIGKWSPFTGGTYRDGLTRLESAFGLEFTGDPGTDYYKSQERKELEKAFRQTRNIKGLKKLMEDTDANRINAELERWSNIESLCPKSGSFSIEKALKEGAVVYIQGSLDDSVVKTATKIFITELIQEARHLDKERNTHLTAVIDEVSFLASKTLAQALATAVGFRVNFVLAYQSQNDLLNIDDKTVNPKYIHQSINVNSQIKAIYGGADFETAEWAANLSGTITKEVTKMEKTDISGTGGETWEHQRTVGTLEENFINTNMVLTLPPRVCVFVQPRHLASICFSSFVPVNDMTALETYLNNKEKEYDSITTSENSDKSKAEIQDIETIAEELSQKKQTEEFTISQAKQNKKEAKESDENFLKKIVQKKASIVIPFRGKNKTSNNPNDNEISQAKPEEQISKDINKIRNESPEIQKDNENKVPEFPINFQEKLPTEKEENSIENKDEYLLEESIKRREQNRLRKAKQKAKKIPNHNIKQDKINTEKSQPHQSKSEEKRTDEVELSNDFAIDFGLKDIDLQSDKKTMSILDEPDDD